MSRDVEIGSDIVDHFPVYADDGYTKVSGVTGFTVQVWKDAVAQATTPTILEIGTTGEYSIYFTPDDLGVWSCDVLIPTNKEWWTGEYTVEKAPLTFSSSMSEDTTTVYFTVWGESKSGRASFLTSMTAEIRDHSGILVLSLGTGVGPSSTNTFSFSCLSTYLSYNVPYYISVTANMGSVSWNGNCGFVRIE